MTHFTDLKQPSVFTYRAPALSRNSVIAPIGYAAASMNDRFPRGRTVPIFGLSS